MEQARRIICCSMTGAFDMLKDIEESLSKCTVDKNELSAAHLFISDCIRTISDGNVHTEADLSQWEMLNAEKENGIIFEETPIYLYSDAAAIEMEMKLMEEERDENFFGVYDEIEWNLSEELKELNIFLNQLEEKKLDSKKSHEQALKKYEEDSENVFVAYFRVIDELENIDKTIMQAQYLCELPLTALKEKFDRFLESFNFHVINKFLEAAKTNGGDRCRKVMVELRIIEERSSAILYENCIFECLLKAQQAALTHTMSLTDTIGKEDKTSLKTNLQNEMTILKSIKTHEDIVADFKSDLISLSQMSANVNKLKHVLDMCISKYNRLHYWLLQTENWRDCIKSENKLINDVLHVLETEKEEASKVSCFLKDLKTRLKRKHEDAVCKTAFMQTQLQNPIENSILYNVLLNILCEFPIDKSISTKLLRKQLEETITHIKKSNVWKQDNFIRSFKDKRCLLFENNYLFKLISSHGKEPVVNHSESIDTYQQRLSDSEKALCAINQDFIEKQNILSTNYFMKHRRLLWLYILCDEEKLAEVLSHVNEYLSAV